MKCDITVGRLAEMFNMSRSALLYYDRMGLLHSAARSGGNYRLYSQCDVERLRQVCLYRKMGIPLKEILRLLNRTKNGGTPSREILRRRLASLETEIESLQTQQRQIVRLLEQLSLKKNSAGVGGIFSQKSRARTKGKKSVGKLEMENQMISKKRWVEIMDAAGLTEADKKNWHAQFEKMEPAAHQEFLESLGIDADEIAKIRKWSKG